MNLHLSMGGWERELLNLPNLPLLLENLHRKLDDESKRRMSFREWLTGDTRAEFINGQIVMHSPASEGHGEAITNLSTLLNTFSIVHDLGAVRVENYAAAFPRNDYMPDLMFFKKSVAETFKKDMNIYPIPEFAIEVLSKSTWKTDKTTKYEDYQANGVREYWIVDPKTQIIEQYALPTEDALRYALIRKATIDSEIESVVIPNFKIPVRAIFESPITGETLRNFFIK
jgi:Uma2 family endonuclease